MGLVVSSTDDGRQWYIQTPPEINICRRMQALCKAVNTEMKEKERKLKKNEKKRKKEKEIIHA